MSFHVGVMLYYSNVLLLTGTVTLEDLAMLEYGLPYDEVTSLQRRKMLVRRREKMMASCFHADERQSAEKERAERTAYRLLRWAGMAIMIVTWMAYLIAPGRAFEWLRQWGGLLIHSPLILTLLVMAMVALPMVIRLWAEPDEIGEPGILVMQKREA